MSDLKECSVLFKDLGHPVRLKILCLLLREGRQCVCRMLPELGIPQPTLSRHLSLLKGHGYIEDDREGTMVFYSVSDPRIGQTMAAAGLPCAQGKDGGGSCCGRSDEAPPAMRRDQDGKHPPGVGRRQGLLAPDDLHRRYGFGRVARRPGRLND